MRIAGIVAIAAIGLYTLLALIQLWFKVFEPAFFVKLSITIATVVIAFVVSALIRREYLNDKKQKEQGFID